MLNIEEEFHFLTMQLGYEYTVIIEKKRNVITIHLTGIFCSIILNKYLD
jgi:hypothetical protein